MAYIQFIIPNDGHRKMVRMQVLGSMLNWFKYYDVKFEVDLAGYELNYHFTHPADLSFFIMNPPDLPQKFNVVN